MKKQPTLRLRLRTVLLLLSVLVLVLPVAGLQVLRVYESVLVRQTQVSLVTQSAYVVAAYRHALGTEIGVEPARYGRPKARLESEAAQTLDLDESDLHPPLAPAQPAQPPEPLAARVGALIGTTVQDATAATGASVRVFDADGVVVATTHDDIGMSLSHSEEAVGALAGRRRSVLRRIDMAPLSMVALSRNEAVRVHVASPILYDDRVVGGVLMARSPSTIVSSIYRNRWLLIQAAVLVLVVIVAVALVAARTLVLPIRRLRLATGRLARQETEHFEAGRPYRVIELAELAASVEAMAESLQLRTRYVRDFTHHVNHEFKTPIASMRGTVELLREHLDEMSRDEAGQFLANLDADATRLQRLALRLLELADADMAPPAREITEVGDVVAALDRPHVHVECASAPMRARIARASLEAVLQNLIDNAFECGATRVDVRAGVAAAAMKSPSMQPSSRLLRDDESPGTIFIEVADDGPGISAWNRDRIFDPFFTTRRDAGGTGLGLPISLSLVRHAGGELELAPESAGMAADGTPTGALFRITLPP